MRLKININFVLMSLFTYIQTIFTRVLRISTLNKFVLLGFNLPIITISPVDWYIVVSKTCENFKSTVIKLDLIIFNYIINIRDPFNTLLFIIYFYLRTLSFTVHLIMDKCVFFRRYPRIFLLCPYYVYCLFSFYHPYLGWNSH